MQLTAVKETREDVATKLMASGRYKSPLQVPRLEKIVVNIGTRADTDKDSFNSVVGDLATITGQKPLITRARKSISNFKLREGMPIGAKVTLRGTRMYDFLARLVHAALPRIRDFRGVGTSGFDGRGSYTLGVQEQIIFPEIDPDAVKKNQGMNITIVTTAKSDDEARELLTMYGMPFKKAAN